METLDWSKTPRRMNIIFNNNDNSINWGRPKFYALNSLLGTEDTVPEQQHGGDASYAIPHTGMVPTTIQISRFNVRSNKVTRFIPKVVWSLSNVTGLENLKSQIWDIKLDIGTRTMSTCWIGWLISSNCLCQVRRLCINSCWFVIFSDRSIAIQGTNGNGLGMLRIATLALTYHLRCMCVFRRGHICNIRENAWTDLNKKMLWTVLTLRKKYLGTLWRCSGSPSVYGSFYYWGKDGLLTTWRKTRVWIIMKV